MNNKETQQKRKETFKSMTSAQRKALIKLKMKEQGLKEGSGVENIDYNNDEVWDLIKITSCFPEMQSKQQNDKHIS